MRSFLILALVGIPRIVRGVQQQRNARRHRDYDFALAELRICQRDRSRKHRCHGLPMTQAPKVCAWTLSGVGTLSNQTTTSATYTAPATVTATSVATVVATSNATSSVTASLPITVSPAGTAINVVPISVSGGPLAPTSIYPNGAFASVQILRSQYLHLSDYRQCSGGHGIVRPQTVGFAGYDSSCPVERR